MEKKLLSEELETYDKHKAELLKESVGKYVLIKGKDIINIFDTQNDAIKVGIDKFGNTPFLVKKIEEVESKQNFTSNLIRVKHHALGNY
ncbi:hypothetical protein J4221_05570 [Candidatus Pacearchaeota archaeon]|nr:hypothetical protein [Candidatus Pacearchaeota archaeon]